MLVCFRRQRPDFLDTGSGDAEAQNVILIEINTEAVTPENDTESQLTPTAARPHAGKYRMTCNQLR
jgi:hypothetical protein